MSEEERRRGRLGVVVAAVVALAYGLALLVRGHAYDIDRLTVHLATAQIFLDAIRHAELPLWSNALWSGYPVHAWGEGGYFSPLRLTWLIANDAVLALDLEFVVAIVLAAVAGAWAGLLLGCRAPGAALAGIVWALGGGLLTQHTAPNHLAAFLPLPLCLAFALRGRALGLALTGTWTLLAGYPYAFMLMVGIGAPAWLIGGRRPDEPVSRHLARGAGAFGLALALGAIQWIPTAELLLESDRWAGYAAQARAQGVVTPGDLIYLVFPLVPNSIRFSAHKAVLAYLGVFACVLAAAGGRAARDRRGRSLVALGALSLAGALLLSTSLGFRLTALPGLRLLRGPSILLTPFGLAIALLAGRGLDAMKVKGAAVRWACVAIVALELCSYGQATAVTVDRDALRAPPRVAQLVGSGARIRVTGTGSLQGDALARAEDERAALYEGQPLDANYGALYGLEHLAGYSALRLPANLDYALVTTAARLRRAATPYLVTGPALDPGPGFVRIASARRWTLYAVPDALPRAYTCFAVSAVASRAAALDAVDALPLSVAVVQGEGGRRVSQRLPGESTRAPRPAKIVSWTTQRIELESAADQPGLLVVVDSLFPGWGAELDGAPAPLVRANVISKGVFVPAGEHRVVLTYRPGSFTAGAGLSLVAALALLAWALHRRRRLASEGTQEGAPRPPSEGSALEDDSTS